MKLRSSDHLLQPWYIHHVAAGFALEDVWALRTPGGPQDFQRLVDLVWSSFDRGIGGGARFLLAARWKLGGWLGWDRPAEGLGRRVTSLRDGLPPGVNLSASTFPAAAGGVPFSLVYQLDREWAAELANATVHGVLHLGWVKADDQHYSGQLAVLVRPNGWTGSLYLAAIKPFRMLIYPAWIRWIERQWAQ